VRLKSGFHDEIDLKIECRTEIVLQFTKGDESKPCIGLEFNQDIEVTIGSLLSSDVGAENPHLGDVIVLLKKWRNLLEISFDVSEGLHHRSKVIRVFERLFDNTGIVKDCTIELNLGRPLD
jgi:hypothetical protein